MSSFKNTLEELKETSSRGGKPALIAVCTLFLLPVLILALHAVVLLFCSGVLWFAYNAIAQAFSLPQLSFWVIFMFVVALRVIVLLLSSVGNRRD